MGAKRRTRRRLQSMQLASVEVGVDGQTAHADNSDFFNQGEDLDQVLLNDVLSTLAHLETRSKNRRSLGIIPIQFTKRKGAYGENCIECAGGFTCQYSEDRTLSVSQQMCLKTNIATGGECKYDSECTSGYCASKKCKDTLKAGAECKENYECLSGYCASKKCEHVDKKKNYEPCKENYECLSGYCTGSTEECWP